MLHRVDTARSRIGARLLGHLRPYEMLRLVQWLRLPPCGAYQYVGRQLLSRQGRSRRGEPLGRACGRKTECQWKYRPCHCHRG